MVGDTWCSMPSESSGQDLEVYMVTGPIISLEAAMNIHIKARPTWSITDF